MPADDKTLRLGGLGVAALQSAPQNRLVQRRRKAHHIEGNQRPAAHRVHIRQRIGGGDRPKFIRIIGNRREKIHGNDQCRIVVDPINGGVIARLGPHQQVRMPQQRNIAQDLAQVLQRKLGRSTGAMRKLGEADGGIGSGLGHKATSLVLTAQTAAGSQSNPRPECRRAAG